jgi:Ca2+:H+ antiporter
MLLFLSYIIGLWFTLRTHAAVIWNSEIDEKKLQASESNPTSGQQPLSGAPYGRVQRTSVQLRLLAELTSANPSYTKRF